MSEKEDNRLVVCPLPLFNEVLNFLGQQQYSQVADLMTRVQGSVQLIDQPQKEEEVNEDGE
jgi:hypothetical protein